MRQGTYAIAAILLALLAAAWWHGWTEDLFAAEHIRELVQDAGIWGPVVYIALAGASFTVFLLAPVVWVSVALWPIPWAFAYSFIAALLASLLTYAATFAIGRDWARQRVPANLARWEERIERRPILAIVAMRALLWANPFVDMFAAISRVSTRAYVFGTVLGLVGPTAFQVILGAGGGALVSTLTTTVAP